MPNEYSNGVFCAYGFKSKLQIIFFLSRCVCVRVVEWNKEEAGRYREGGRATKLEERV